MMRNKNSIAIANTAVFATRKDDEPKNKKKLQTAFSIA